MSFICLESENNQANSHSQTNAYHANFNWHLLMLFWRQSTGRVDNQRRWCRDLPVCWRSFYNCRASCGTCIHRYSKRSEIRNHSEFCSRKRTYTSEQMRPKRPLKISPVLIRQFKIQQQAPIFLQYTLVTISTVHCGDYFYSTLWWLFSWNT